MNETNMHSTDRPNKAVADAQSWLVGTRRARRREEAASGDGHAPKGDSRAMDTTQTPE
jgi:hypothetical protein